MIAGPPRGGGIVAEWRDARVEKELAVAFVAMGLASVARTTEGAAD